MRRAQRNREHGNTMILALIVLSALATLGMLTTVSVQSSFRASTNDRSQAIALYAAESGAALIMDHLRHNFDPSPMSGPTGASPWSRPKAWSRFVSPRNTAPVTLNAGDPDGEPTSGVSPGPFGAKIAAWYETKIFNNKDDVPPPVIIGGVYTPYPSPPSGYADGADYDGRVIIQITGHGPQDATAILEVEVQWPIEQVSDTPAPTSSPPQPNALHLTILGWHVVNL